MKCYFKISLLLIQSFLFKKGNPFPQSVNEEWGDVTPVFFSLLLLLLLQAFVTKVETTEMPLLEQRLAQSNARLCFLVDYVELSTADMDLNRLTVQWYRRMPSVFQDHRLILTDKTKHYQADLKVSA